MKKILLLLVFTYMGSLQCFGQVSDINKNIEEDKNSAEKDRAGQAVSSSENNIGNGIFGFVVQIFSATIGAAQRGSLQNIDTYPERISFESFTSIGTDFKFPTQVNHFQLGVRGNWGIFGTDFRFYNLNDPTGYLGVIDWKVLVVRIPIKGFKIDYGIGFVNIQAESQSYFSSSIGFDWRLPNRATNISTKYLWTERSNLGSRFNRGLIIRVDTEVYNYRKIHLSPSLEYSYQNYFNETEFSIFSAGVLFRIY